MALFVVGVTTSREGRCSATVFADRLILNIAMTAAPKPSTLAAPRSAGAMDDPRNVETRLPRQETTVERRVFEAEQVSREDPDTVLGKPIVTLSVADGSHLQMRMGPACKSLGHIGFSLAGRF
jgi:hypothetical protein